MVNSSQYEINLENYSGPLDLLLHLIREKSVDIFTIDLSTLTNQFLMFINENKSLDIEHLGDFLVMASYLVEIKSKYLLPKEVIQIDDNYENNNHDQLVKKLLEYKQIKEVSGFFKDQHYEGVKLLSKEKTIIKSHSTNIPTINFETTNLPITTLVNTFNKILLRIKEKKLQESTLILKEVSPEEMATKILQILESHPTDWLLNDVLTELYLSLPIVMACFVAILDLVRLQKIAIFQASHLNDIYLRYIGAREMGEYNE